MAPNGQLEKGNRQLVIWQNGLYRQSGGLVWYGLVWFGRGGGMFGNVLEFSRIFWETPKSFMGGLVVVCCN